MEESRFWTIIDEARGKSAGPQSPSAEPAALKTILSGLSDEEVVAFGLAFDAQLVRLRRWSVWGAGYVIHGGMGDDSFHYFCSWFVGKGKAVVEQTLSDPDGLGAFVTDPEDVDNELLEYVAIEILEERGLEDLRSGEGNGEPQGEPFEEDSLAESYPRLAKAFGYSD